jgi:hypothetical protein
LPYTEPYARCCDAEVILNQPGVGALIGHGKAAGMPQHLRMSMEGQDGVTILASLYFCSSRLTVEYRKPLGFGGSRQNRVLPPDPLAYDLRQTKSQTSAKDHKVGFRFSGCTTDPPKRIETLDLSCTPGLWAESYRQVFGRRKFSLVTDKSQAYTIVGFNA